jgi:hypothetical protein
MKKQVLALAAVIALTLPLAAQAQMVQQEIMVAQPTGNVVSIPDNRVDAGQHLLFRVVNPTSQVATFAIPELGISYGVAPNSERTFFVDMANVHDQSIAYSVTGPNGQQIAAGNIINEDYFTTGSTTSLASIINYSTAYNAPADPEPAYYTERPVSTNQSIRGFW